MPTANPPATVEATGSSRPKPGRKRGSGTEPLGGVQIAEEAFHLLRMAPLSDLFLYYLGTVPFLLGLFFFWADMSRSSYAASSAALGALGLAIAFVWMKFWQGLFCRRLWQQIHPSGAQVELSGKRYARYLAAQAFLHAFSLPGHLLALIFIGWPLALFQNASVLAFSQDYGNRPLRHLCHDAAHLAQRNWSQNYQVLLLVLIVAFFIWINVLGAAVLVPMGLKIFLGIETVFTLSPENAILNTTFLFGTTLLSLLVIDPFLKSIYTLRCFRAKSLTSGADLISRLDSIETSRAGESGSPLRPPTGIASLLFALLGLSTLLGESATAEESSTPAPRTLELSHSIENTLKERQYQWRLPRQEVDAGAAAGRGWLAGAMTDLANSVEEVIRNLGESIDQFFEDLFDGKRSSRSGPGTGISGGGEGIGSIAKIAFISIVLALVTWVIFLVIRNARGKSSASTEGPSPAGPIDLESDHIVATQLPEDEWMRLAREQIAKGQHRLAMRALFLASLAHLGDRGLLQVARFKSNRDYTRELGLKARSLPELRGAFQENVNLFERAWYGLHEMSREATDHFAANYACITRESAPHAATSPTSTAPHR